jgi:hypothetical protein
MNASGSGIGGFAASLLAGFEAGEFSLALFVLARGVFVAGLLLIFQSAVKPVTSLSHGVVLSVSTGERRIVATQAKSFNRIADSFVPIQYL